MFLAEYINICFYILCLIFIFSILIILNIVSVMRFNYLEKITSYECGFQSFEYAISNFDVRYYVVAVLFLLFDLELIFFIPFLMSINFINLTGIISIFFFFILLVLAFLYEWKLGILNFSDILYYEFKNKQKLLLKKTKKLKKNDIS